MKISVPWMTLGLGLLICVVVVGYGKASVRPPENPRTVGPAAHSPSVGTVVDPGDPVPGFLIDRVEGGTFSLQDLRGRYVLVDFWAVWCRLCEAQLPHLAAAWREFGQRNDFVMLGLCLGEDAGAIRGFLERHHEPWSQGMLPAGFSDPVAEYFGVTGLPRILLLDPDGRVVADNLVDGEIGEALRRAFSPGAEL